MSKIILVLLLTISSVHAQPAWLVAPSPPPVESSRIKLRVGAALLAVGLAAFLSAVPLDLDAIVKCGPISVNCHRADLELVSSFGFLLGGGVTALAGVGYLSTNDRR